MRCFVSVPILIAFAKNFIFTGIVCLLVSIHAGAVHFKFKSTNQNFTDYQHCVNLMQFDDSITKKSDCCFSFPRPNCNFNFIYSFNKSLKSTLHHFRSDGNTKNLFKINDENIGTIKQWKILPFTYILITYWNVRYFSHLNEYIIDWYHQSTIEWKFQNEIMYHSNLYQANIQFQMKKAKRDSTIEPYTHNNHSLDYNSLNRA